MLNIKDLSMVYGDEVVLDKINLSVKKGECLVVLGPSGCGKTTLLHLMAGIKQPSDGVVEYQGKRVLQPIREISIIFQGYGLFPWKTVKENMILPYKIRREKVKKEELTDVVEELGLEKHLKKYPSQLSGGQKQRVAIGRAMLNNAKVILMDEPFSALDMETKKNLQASLKQLFKTKNITVIMVTHSVEEALFWGDQIAVFKKEGRGFEKVVQNKYKDELSKKDDFIRMIS